MGSHGKVSAIERTHMMHLCKLVDIMTDPLKIEELVAL
jgi:hypothetical protein